VALLQVDEHAAGVQHGVVGGVHAHERAEVLDVGVFEHGMRGLQLQLRHAVEGHVLRGLHAALQLAGVLRGEQALRNRQVQHHGQHHGQQRDQQRERLVLDDPVQRAVVAHHHAVEEALRARAEAGAGGVFLRLVLEPARRHHRHQRERDHGRDQDGDGQRHRELAEQPAHHVAHEQQRNQHRDERHGQRDDGEADLRGALEGGLQRLFALLDVARDVLDHDDRVVHHEAGGNGERHQAQVVQAVAQQVHEPEGADERDGHRDAGDDGGAQAAQKGKDHQHHQHHGQHQFHLDVFHRRADAGGAVAQHVDLQPRRKARLQLGQLLLDGVDRGDHVGAGLALHVQDDGRRELVTPWPCCRPRRPAACSRRC
jgi:hypothetical protein